MNLEDRKEAERVFGPASEEDSPTNETATPSRLRDRMARLLRLCGGITPDSTAIELDAERSDVVAKLRASGDLFSKGRRRLMEVSPKASAVRIRWVVREDMPALLAIERQCFRDAWTESDFAAVLRQYNVTGVVACEGDCVLGFSVYELGNADCRILDLAVAAEHRNRGVGSAFVERLVQKTWQGRRVEILAAVSERNVAAQVFFRGRGFLAESVLRDYFRRGDEITEDAYEFVYRNS